MPEINITDLLRDSAAYLRQYHRSIRLVRENDPRAAALLDMIPIAKQPHALLSDECDAIAALLERHTDAANQTGAGS